jgi:hypothetical protein
MAINTVKDLITVLSNFPDEAPVSMDGDYGMGATLWIGHKPVLESSDFFDG